MKIRIDYVSNSSSSSFIVDFSDKGKCIDEKFMKLLKRCNYVSISGDCKNEKQLKELKERAEGIFGEGSVEEYADEHYLCVEANRENLKPGDQGQIDLMRDILKLKNSGFRCGCGDDYGEDLCRAVQTATVMESRYKDIEISGDDHFDYDSIRGTDLDD